MEGRKYRSEEIGEQKKQKMEGREYTIQKLINKKIEEC